jgi:hypothetical protein
MTSCGLWPVASLQGLLDQYCSSNAVVQDQSDLLYELRQRLLDRSRAGIRHPPGHPRPAHQIALASDTSQCGEAVQLQKAAGWGVQRGMAPSPVLSPPKGRVCEDIPHIILLFFLQNMGTHQPPFATRIAPTSQTYWDAPRLFEWYCFERTEQHVRFTLLQIRNTDEREYP